MNVHGDPVRDPIGAKDPGVASSVLSRERLVGPGLEAQDVLRSEPGVAVTESGGFGAPSTAAIRGATAADTPVYLAGVRLNDDVAGTADLSLVPLWLIDHIEVYRGNAPIDADRLGAGGAIFFEPRRPTSAVPQMGGAGYYGGSWGASKGWAYEGVHAGPVSALVGVSGDRATNRYPYVDDHGELFEPQLATRAIRENADESTLEGWGLARVDFGGGASLDVLVNAIARDQGVPSLALVPTREAREQADRTLASIAVHAPVGPAAVFDARTSVLVGRTHYDDPLLELTLYTRELTVVGRRVEQELGATVDVTDSAARAPGREPRVRGHRARPEHHPARPRPARVRARGGHRRGDARALVHGLRVLASGECHNTGADPGAACDVLQPTGRAGAEAGSGRLQRPREREPLRPRAHARGGVRRVGHRARQPGPGARGGVHGRPRAPRCRRRGGGILDGRVPRRLRVRALGRRPHRVRAHGAGLRHALQRREGPRRGRGAARGARADEARARRDSPRPRSTRATRRPRARPSTTSSRTARDSSPRRACAPTGSAGAATA